MRLRPALTHSSTVVARKVQIAILEGCECNHAHVRERILVPIDFSEPSERALSAAIELARTFGARLALLHVWSIPNAAYARELSWPVVDVEATARAALERVRARVAEVYPETEAVLRKGSEWQSILDVVKEQRMDLIVMGTHGRRGLPRWLIGSVAEKVVRLSPVPVLTVGGPSSMEERARR